MANPASDVFFAKLTGGHTHNSQSVFFNVVGINMSWDAEGLSIVGPWSASRRHRRLSAVHGQCRRTRPPRGVRVESCAGNPDLGTDWEFDVRTNALSDNDDGTFREVSTFAERVWFSVSGPRWFKPT